MLSQEPQHYSLVRENIHELKVDGERLLFHVPSSGLFALDESSARVLDLFKCSQHFSENEAQKALHSHLAPAQIQETLDELEALEIISKRNEKHPETPKRMLDHFPLNTLVLNVNTGCNLSCTYCYKEDLTQPSKGQKMNFATARQSIEMLLRQLPDESRYNLVFFGGEPLSNLPLIKEVVEYSEGLFAALDKKVDFSMTTNATLLKDDTIRYLDEHRFGLAISMDGPQAIHDRNRITVGGQGTYALVAERVTQLLKQYRSRPVGARVTLTHGTTDIVTIWDHLFNELGFHEVGFAPVTAGDIAAYNLTENEMVQVFDGMKTLGNRYLEAALSGRNIGFSNLHQLMTDLYEGTKKALPCGAGVGMVAIDHKGGVNLCHRFTGSEMPQFGDVHKGIDQPRLSQFLEQRLDRSNTGCQTCRIRNICSGGCYHESYIRYNDPVHPTYHYCDLLRDWIDFGVGVYHQILKHNPGFFEQHISPRRAQR